MTRRRFETDDPTAVREPGVEPHAGVLPNLDDEPGPARRLSSARTARMVDDILAAALAPVVEAAPPAPARRAPRRLVPLMAAALVAAALVGAAAAVVTTRLLAAPTAAPPAAVAPIDEPAPAPIDEPAPAPIDEPAPAPIDEPAQVDEPTPPRPRPPALDRALSDDAPAADVMALANQRRKERAWREADALYRRVAARFVGTDAAIVAMVASATLHLEHLGDPRRALTGYQRALAARPGGALAEEARWGIAEARRALGDPAAEAAALRAFLAAHPDAALAPAARRRLGELSSTP